jgi:nucleosome assembly protein 1-like 1
MSDQPVVAAPHIDEEEKEIEQKMIKVISQMPKETQNRFKALKVLSDKRSKLSDEFEKEIKELEARIAEKKKPLYVTRTKVINGEILDFTEYIPKFDETHKNLEEQCALIITKAAEGSKEEKDKKEDDEIKPVEVDHLKTVNGVPDFWYKAIKNNQMIWELVKEKDEEILKHVTHVDTVRTTEPEKTLQVNFTFSANKFFPEPKLSLTIHYKGDEDDVEKIEGTAISWNEGVDPTKKKVKKKQKHKKTNETRTIVKTVEAESFFNLFTSRTAPAEDAQLESDEENELQDKIDMAMNLAEDCEDVLIPDALEYYLGLNDDLYGDMEGDEDDDEDDEDHDEDSDEDDKKKKPAAKKGGKGGDKGGDKAGAAGAAAGGEQQECKQQ